MSEFTVTSTKQKAGLSDYLAVERTSLAWTRTGLALMGFGFVVARFGLFLEAFALARPGSAPPSHQFSLWSGTVLIGVGVAVNIYSAWHHARLVAELNRGEPVHRRSSKQAVIIALFLAVVGLTMAVYLALIREPG